MKIEIFGQTIELDTTYVAEPDSVIADQLVEYKTAEREQFSLTIGFLNGFIGAVHRMLCTIPYGETKTYGELASDLETAPIAIGQACARNPLLVLIPCHRVVGVDSFCGYRYPGLQQRLLALEGAAVERLYR